MKLKSRLFFSFETIGNPIFFNESNPPFALATLSNPMSLSAFVANADLNPKAQNKTIFLSSPIFFLESKNFLDLAKILSFLLGYELKSLIVPSFHNSLMSLTSISVTSPFSYALFTCSGDNVFIVLFASSTSSLEDLIFMIIKYRPMKEIKSAKKTHFLKKVLIKICRIFGYELIDQSSFEFPVSNKRYNEQIGVPGKSSITLGLGETKITRNVKSLNIIIKTCTSVQLVSQNKKRIFEKEKI